MKGIGAQWSTPRLIVNGFLASEISQSINAGAPFLDENKDEDEEDNEDDDENKDDDKDEDEDDEDDEDKVEDEDH